VERIEPRKPRRSDGFQIPARISRRASGLCPHLRVEFRYPTVLPGERICGTKSCGVGRQSGRAGRHAPGEPKPGRLQQRRAPEVGELDLPSSIRARRDKHIGGLQILLQHPCPMGDRDRLRNPDNHPHRVLSFHPRHDVRSIVHNLIENMDKFSDWDNALYYNILTFRINRARACVDIALHSRFLGNVS
jgi:hypothetical protein